MRKRIALGAVAAILCLGGFAVAQNSPVISVNADNKIIDQERTTLSGGVTITVDGVAVRADRAVIQNGVISLEGNVRMTLPSRFRVASQF